MQSHSKYPWFILDILVFVAINAVVLWFLHTHGGFVLPLDLFHLFVLGLAVFRGADIIANETITKPIRAPFVNIKEEKEKEIEVPKTRGFRGSFGSLLYCPSCMGMWVAMVLVYSYMLWPSPTFVIVIILALSGVERVLTSSYNFIKKEVSVLGD